MYGEYRSTAYFQGQGVDLLRQAGVTRSRRRFRIRRSRALPAFTFSGYTGFSGNAGDGRPKWQNRGEYEVTDNVTWIKGPHILKFGGRVYRRNILFTDARTHNGSLRLHRRHDAEPRIARPGTGDAFADFLLGYPANAGAIEPGHVVGRLRHLLARLRPGRSESRRTH